LQKDQELVNQEMKKIEEKRKNPYNNKVLKTNKDKENVKTPVENNPFLNVNPVKPNSNKNQLDSKKIPQIKSPRGIE